MTNSSQESENQSPSRGKGLGRKTTGGIVVVALVAVYSFVQPKLNEQFGLNLPGIRQANNGQVVLDEAPKKSPAKNATVEPVPAIKTPVIKTPSAKVAGSDGKQTQGGTKSGGTAKLGSGPLADRMKSAKSKASPKPQQRVAPPKQTSTQVSAKNNAKNRQPSIKTPAAPPQAKDSSPPDSDLLYGILREIGPKRYMSPAGLRYLPGSAEGHRLEHLRRHTKDMKARPVHGVFDGEMPGALKTIDQAYERAKKNQRTTKKSEDGRTIYTVDMGKRVGFIGGRAGQRKRNPMARRVRLVLDGSNVITAFPTD